MVNGVRLQQARTGLTNLTQYQPVAHQEKTDAENGVTQTAAKKKHSNAITQTVGWIKNNPTKAFLGSLFALGSVDVSHR